MSQFAELAQEAEEATALSCGWPASGVAESSHPATPSAGRGFGSDLAILGANPWRESEVRSVDNPHEGEADPLAYGRGPSNPPPRAPNQRLHPRPLCGFPFIVYGVGGPHKTHHRFIKFLENQVGALPPLPRPLEVSASYSVKEHWVLLGDDFRNMFSVFSAMLDSSESMSVYGGLRSILVGGGMFLHSLVVSPRHRQLRKSSLFGPEQRYYGAAKCVC